MTENPITGQTLRWTFRDGPMAGKTFDHTFNRHGGVKFQEINGEPKGKPGSAETYEVVTVGEFVHAVSYLAGSGYTLTVVMDYRTRKLVAFASNEKSLTVQHGTFETVAEQVR